MSIMIMTIMMMIKMLVSGCTRRNYLRIKTVWTKPWWLPYLTFFNMHVAT